MKFVGFQVKNDKAQLVPESDATFNLSQVTLQPGTCPKGEATQLFVTVEEGTILLVVLREGGVESITLNLFFGPMQEPSFSVKGKGTVHICGFASLNDDDDDDFDEEVESGDGEFTSLPLFHIPSMWHSMSIIYVLLLMLFFKMLFVVVLIRFC